MARPNTTRRSVRVQVAPPPQSPGLGVYAPLEVQTPGAETDSLQGLVQALGIGSTILKAASDERKDFDRKAGAADETLGRADMERAKKSRAYADGAYEVAILEQYQDAEMKVSERVQADLDRSLPVDQQIGIVDGYMKSELGPLVSDPSAKLLIAGRYQKFIETFGGNVLNAQVEARANAAYDVTQRDVVSQMQREGTINWTEHWQRLTSQNGDGTKSTEVLVGAVAQQILESAQRGEADYAKWRDLIPTEIATEDGQSIRGPLYSPKHADTITRALLQAEDAYNLVQRPKLAAEEFQNGVVLDRMAATGVPITEDTFKAMGLRVGREPTDHFTPEQARSWIRASEEQALRKKEDENVLGGALDARRINGRWVDITGLPGAPESAEKTQKLFDGWVQLVLTGNGAGPEHLGGGGMVANTGLVNTVVTLAAQEGLPYGPLKRTMSEINQAAPGDMAARLEAYKLMKAKGVAPLFIDDDAALIYEVALGAADAGAKPDEVAARVRTMGDKSSAQYVSHGLSQLQVRKSGFEVETGSGVFGPKTVNSRKTLNAGYLAARYERLVASALSKDLSLDKAQEYAQERITQSHVALAVDENFVVVPRNAVRNPRLATEALDWYTEQLPAIARKLGLPEDGVSIHPLVDINGRGLQFELVREGGVRIPDRAPFTLEGLIDTYRRNNPATDERAKAERAKADAANEQSQQRRRAFRDAPATLIRHK